MKKTKPTDSTDVGAPLNGWIRALSALAALAVMVLVVCYPRAVAHDGASVPHGSFVLLMMGMSVCWIVGFGFVPKNKVLRLLFSAPVGWLLMLAGLWLVFGRTL